MHIHGFIYVWHDTSPGHLGHPYPSLMYVHYLYLGYVIDIIASIMTLPKAEVAVNQ